MATLVGGTSNGISILTGANPNKSGNQVDKGGKGGKPC